MPLQPCRNVYLLIYIVDMMPCSSCIVDANFWNSEIVSSTVWHDWQLEESSTVSCRMTKGEFRFLHWSDMAETPTFHLMFTSLLRGPTVFPIFVDTNDFNRAATSGSRHKSSRREVAVASFKGRSDETNCLEPSSAAWRSSGGTPHDFAFSSMLSAESGRKHDWISAFWTSIGCFLINSAAPFVSLAISVATRPAKPFAVLPTQSKHFWYHFVPVCGCTSGTTLSELPMRKNAKRISHFYGQQNRNERCFKWKVLDSRNWCTFKNESRVKKGKVRELLIYKKVTPNLPLVRNYRFNCPLLAKWWTKTLKQQII